MQWDRDRRTLLEVASWGRLRGELVVEFEREGGFITRAADSSGPLIEPVCGSASLGPSARGEPIAYGLAAPVRAAGPPLGVLCAGFEERPPAGPFAWWCAETYANLAALCLTEPGALERIALDAGPRDDSQRRFSPVAAHSVEG